MFSQACVTSYGCCIVVNRQTPLPANRRQANNWAGGTHPTGMHPCYARGVGQTNRQTNKHIHFK